MRAVHCIWNFQKKLIYGYTDELYKFTILHESKHTRKIQVSPDLESYIALLLYYLKRFINSFNKKYFIYMHFIKSEHQLSTWLIEQNK